MNIESELAKFHSELQETQKKYDNLCKDYKASKLFTVKFLQECKKRKITTVAVGCQHDSVKSSMSWPFSHKNSVFADGEGRDGYPQIWRVVENLGISGGCGNEGQHYITEEGQAKLVEGTYRFVKGKWNKIN